MLAAVTHHWREVTAIGLTVEPMVALVIDGGLAAGIVYGGWRLRRADLADAGERSVAVWTVGGVPVGVGLELTTLGIQRLEGRTIEEPGFHLLVTVGISALVLLVAGYYSARNRATARRYESLLDNTFQFIGLLRPDGTVVEANDTALEFGGLEPDEVLGERFPDTPWWGHSEAASERVEGAIDRAAGGEFVRYETDVQGADGLRTVDFSAKPVHDRHGEVERVIVEGRDITDRRQQRQHLQVLNRVLRHNVRNDLTKLRGWTRRTAEASDPDERAANADRVARVMDSWETLVADAKTIRRAVERERSASVPVGSLVTEIVDAKRRAHPTAEIGLTLPGTETTARSVSSTIRGAIDEAIDNAVESTADETPTVEVLVVDTGPDWVRVEIGDDGPGLPEAEAAVLETGEETEMIHGDGLGVWKIRMLVEQSGGRLSVDADDGTRLSLLLPTR